MGEYRLYSKQVKGFSLIELMVSITIIAILSTIGLMVFTETQKASRDFKRKQDLRSISQALEIYFQKQGHYPCTDNSSNTGWQLKTSSSNWISNVNTLTGCSSGGSLDSNYISALPIDPKATSNLPWNSSSDYSYAYFAGNTDSVNNPGCHGNSGQYYILVARLERAGDPEAVGKKQYFFCDTKRSGGASLVIDSSVGGVRLIPYTSTTQASQLFIITSEP